jgi:UDPglucose--hexose-1-phosphate uridylyltransferase
MSEIRYCKLRDTDVIIAPKRLHRPTQFDTPTEHYTIDECPFEVGNEDATPTEIYRTSDKNGEWITRVVPNLYNALDINEENSSKREGFFTKKSAFGAHEVIIETPSHDKKADKYTIEQWSAYLKTINTRVSDLSKDRRLKHIQVFKNHGSRAGATLRHPHSQIIATGFIPNEVKNEYKRCEDYYNIHQRTLLLDIANEELRIGKRVVFENNTFLAFAPYASLYPFEIIISPKEHIGSISSLNQQQIHDLAQILKNIYKKLYGVLGDFHYNMIFKTPIESLEYYTFYIQIIPRIYMLAGYELATNMRINPVTPEMAAQKLKEVL